MSKKDGYFYIGPAEEGAPDNKSEGMGVGCLVASVILIVASTALVCYLVGGK